MCSSDLRWKNGREVGWTTPDFVGTTRGQPGPETNPICPVLSLLINLATGPGITSKGLMLESCCAELLSVSPYAGNSRPVFLRLPGRGPKSGSPIKNRKEVIQCLIVLRRGRPRW